MSPARTRRRLRPGQPIPAPADFPVTWQNPGEARRLWRLDPLHYPRPLPLLEHDLHQGYDATGSNLALERYNFPFKWVLRNINGYLYNSVIPKDAPPEIVFRLMYRAKRYAPGLMKRIEARAVAGISAKYVGPLEERLDNLRRVWEGELLPQIKGLLARWRNFDLDGTSWEALLAHLAWTLQANVQAGYFHGLVATPLLYAWSEFDELYKDLFPDAGVFDSHKLVQGFDNTFLQGDRRLWSLGRQALTMPAVQAILETRAAADVIVALRDTGAGKVFLEELNDFVAEHGHRNAFIAYSARGWQEDPTPVIRLLKDYITQPDRDMVAELAAEALERQRRVTEVRAQLQGYPQPVQAKFDRLLPIAQFAKVLHTDHGYWLDCACIYEVRRVMLAFGRRFVNAGILDDAEQIMHLTLKEIEANSAGLAHGRHPDRLQSVVAQRETELDRFAQVQPPLQLGMMPWLEPSADEPMFRAGQKFLGVTVGGALDGTPESTVVGNEIRGNAASPGIARGVVKVVRSLAEAGKLEPGDVLVTETTAPPWTPLFATLAAVVTDTGGILSHSAVVAREYRIPAVVGASNATERLRDGQMVEVDGNEGIVRIYRPATASA